MSIFTLKELIRTTQCSSVERNGKWVPARPVGYRSVKHKLKCLYMVLTNKADLIVWPEGQ